MKRPNKNKRKRGRQRDPVLRTGKFSTKSEKKTFQTYKKGYLKTYRKHIEHYKKYIENMCSENIEKYF